MKFLIAHNLEGHAEILLGTIAGQGWLELLPIQFVTFKEINLSIDSSDRIVWRLAQTNQMILLTANRSMKGEESLEQFLREENTANFLLRKSHAPLVVSSYHKSQNRKDRLIALGK
jgi:hypothetical protein